MPQCHPTPHRYRRARTQAVSPTDPLERNGRRLWPIAVYLPVFLDPRGIHVQLLPSGSQDRCPLLSVLQAPQHNAVPKQSWCLAGLTPLARRHEPYPHVFPFSSIGLPGIYLSVKPFPSPCLHPMAKQPVDGPPYRLIVS